MRAKAAAVLAAVALLCGSVALSSQDSRRVYGAGTTPCAQWTEARDADANSWFVMGQWILGYVSAVNQFSKETPAQVEASAMARQVDAYCRTYPQDDISDAARALVELLLTAAQP
jgi:hypothetical protein